jgi:hypothetical protein
MTCMKSLIHTLQNSLEGASRKWQVRKEKPQGGREHGRI